MLSLQTTVVLQETKGGSAVAIELYFVFPNGSSESISSANCLGGRWSIAAGGTWASEATNPYCMDFLVPVDVAGTQVWLTVVYRDQDGNVGRVSGYATAREADGR